MRTGIVNNLMAFSFRIANESWLDICRFITYNISKVFREKQVDTGMGLDERSGL